MIEVKTLEALRDAASTEVEFQSKQHANVSDILYYAGIVLRSSCERAIASMQAEQHCLPGFAHDRTPNGKCIHCESTEHPAEVTVRPCWRCKGLKQVVGYGGMAPCPACAQQSSPHLVLTNQQEETCEHGRPARFCSGCIPKPEQTAPCPHGEEFERCYECTREEILSAQPALAQECGSFESDGSGKYCLGCGGDHQPSEQPSPKVEVPPIKAWNCEACGTVVHAEDDVRALHAAAVATAERNRELEAQLSDMERQCELLDRLRKFDTGSLELPKGLLLEHSRLDEMWRKLVAERDEARAQRAEAQAALRNERRKERERCAKVLDGSWTKVFADMIRALPEEE